MDDLASTTLTTVSETATELTGTVDVIVHEAEATASGGLPPSDVELEIVPLPVAPPATPTAVPAQPPLP